MAVNVANPQQINMVVSDQRLHKSDAGEPTLQSRTELFLATGTITVGAVVALDPASSTTDKTGVAVKAAALPYAAVVGVANNKTSVTAGNVVEVVVAGLAFVGVGAATPAVGDTAIVQAASADASVDVDDPDATVIEGSVLGSFLGTKNASNIAPVWLLPRF